MSTLPRNEPIESAHATSVTNVGYDQLRPWHTVSVADTAMALGITNTEMDPLTETQSDRVNRDIRRGLNTGHLAQRAIAYGDNKIPIQGGRHPLTILASHFFTSITIIFAVIAGVSIWLKDYGELGVVLFVIVFNGLLGFYQEYSAEKSLNSLKKMTSGTAAVVREGKTVIIPVDDVVVGDTVVLGQGDFVPADIRLVEATNFEVDESLLTGEPLPVRKHYNVIEDPDGSCALGDRKNLAYRSTVVTSGRGLGLCVCGGTQTQVGRISKSLSAGSVTSTPLQRKMNLLLWALFGGCGIVVLIVFASNDFSGEGTVILYAAAVAIAILPEALLAVITVAMTVSVRRMADAKCIVRKLASLEVLGGVTDICSDKTGTLTQNKMTVLKFAGSSGCVYRISGLPMSIHASVTRETDPSDPNADPAKDDDFEMTFREIIAEDSSAMRLIRCGSLCSSTTLVQTDEGVLEGSGNPTEIAIQALAMKFRRGRDALHREGWHGVADFPFDSTIKRMSCICVDRQSQEGFVFCKGAPERMLALCTSKMKKDGSTAPLSTKSRTRFEGIVGRLAKRGLRTVVFAERRLTAEEMQKPDAVERDVAEENLVFLGVVGIYDPPRIESAGAVERCRLAGICVRMLTGDHLETAKAIACEIGIITEDEKHSDGPHCMEGPAFDKLTEEELAALPELPFVVGRCSPETKVKMVDALHARGRVVAMTGDGFNDSSSIKKADVGCAMGSGTDVTKSVADLVISDDNFATIVNAVSEGRRIFTSISKFVIHLLSGNCAEIIVLVLGLPFKNNERSIFILSPIQILWLNMFTGSPPATGLSMDKPDSDILLRPPNRAGMFTKELIADTITYGVFLGVPTLCSFIVTLYGFKGGINDNAMECNKPDGTNCDRIFEARATAFSVLYIGLLLHAYNVRRPRQSVLTMDLFDNHWLWGSVAFGLVTLVPMLYVEPIATNVFVHRMLTWEWGVVGVALLIFMILSELYKVFKNAFFPWEVALAVPGGGTAGSQASITSPNGRPDNASSTFNSASLATTTTKGTPAAAAAALLDRTTEDVAGRSIAESFALRAQQMGDLPSPHEH